MAKYNFPYRINDLEYGTDVSNEIYNYLDEDTLYYPEIRIVNSHALEGAFYHIKRPYVCFENLIEIKEDGMPQCFYAAGRIDARTHNIFPALQIVRGGGLYQAFRAADFRANMTFPELIKIDDANPEGSDYGGMQQAFYGATFGKSCKIKFPKLVYFGEKAFQGAFRNIKTDFSISFTADNIQHVANNAFANAFTNTDTATMVIHYNGNLPSKYRIDLQKALTKGGYKGKLSVGN